MGTDKEVKPQSKRSKFTPNGDFKGRNGANEKPFVDNRPEAANQKKIAKTANSDTQTDNAPTPLSETVTSEVETHLSTREGFRTEVYLDSVGKETAGTGHLLSAAEKVLYPVGTTVPTSVLEAWRQEDAGHAYSGAYMMATEIGLEDQELVNALTAVNFQLGNAWNEIHKKTWSYLENQEWEKAANEAGDSTWFKQTPVRVIDFQRVLLGLAGKANDYDAMVTFNATNITNRDVTMPSQDNIEQFDPGESTTSEEKQDTPGSQTSPTKAAAAKLTGSVGLDKDGQTYIGTSGDIKTVQQQLIYAGILAEEFQRKNGEMASNADGVLGGKTISAIHDFQAQIMGWKKTDGRIDMGGKTWKKLMEFSAAPTTDKGVTEKNDTGAGSDSAPQIKPPETQEKEKTTVPDTNHTDEKDSSGGESIPQNDTATSFKDIPSAYSDKFKIKKSVGYGTNSSTDMTKIKSLLRMLGYKTDTLKTYSKARTKASKELIQLKNAIFHFQQKQEDLSNDGRVDPGGSTWKKMVEIAYLNSGGKNMTDDQISAVHNKRKGTSSDVPSSLNANITGGHLLGVDNSGYLLPDEFHARAAKLKTALETIKDEVGNYRISCAYRSPEHNVKIGSKAGKSQHTQGIAADIQTPAGYSNATLKTAINTLMKDGKIPKGGVGKYSWGVHFDIRGTHKQWNA